MGLVVGVSFRYIQDVQHLRTNDAALEYGNVVVAPSRFGLSLARVVEPPREVAKEEELPELSVLRRASERDFQQNLANRARALWAAQVCAGKIAKHGLPMKLVTVYCALDCRHYTFFFTAPHRVDFRALVRDLAGFFRCRIRLEQIGERDEARVLGGLGRCGRELCCTSWMTKFYPVSMKHAKVQGLAPVPSHLAGPCGKLRCCLLFEYTQYVVTLATMPDLGQRVACGRCVGCVVERNVPKETVVLELENSPRRVEVPAHQCKPVGR